MMVRKQINLTMAQLDALEKMCLETGKSRSQLLREALDTFFEKCRVQRLRAALEAAKGMWKDRDDLPDFAAMRKEDRRL